MDADLLKYRILLNGTIIGTYHPATSLICLITSGEYSALFHEFFHSHQACYTRLQELYLSAYADQFFQRSNWAINRIKDYTEFLEAHVSALVSLSPRAVELEQGIVSVLEQRTGKKVAPYESEYVSILKEISHEICPESPLEGCQTIGIVLLWCEKHGEPAWRQALTDLREHNQIERVRQLCPDHRPDSDLSHTKLILALCQVLDSQGFDTSQDLMYCTERHFIIARIYKLLHCYLTLSYSTIKRTELLISILPTMTNYLLRLEGLKPACFVDPIEGKLTLTMFIPSSSYLAKIGKGFQQVAYEEKCHVAKILADFFQGASVLERHEPEAYFSAFFEAMAKFESLFLCTTPKCRVCATVSKGLTTQIRQERGDAKLINKSTGVLSELIGKYQSWINGYAFRQGVELALSSGLFAFPSSVEG